MERRYVDVQRARFQVVRVDSAEQIVIPARRSWFVLIFLAVWLTVWTIGGFAAFYEVTQNFDWFLVLWLGMWAFGWASAAFTIAWQINGNERLRIVGGDLEVRHSALGMGKAWWFRGNEIHNLSGCDRPWFPFGWGLFDAPFLFWRRWGAVKFHYGARTIYLATALDEAEGELIVEQLRKYLPHTVR